MKMRGKVSAKQNAEYQFKNEDSDCNHGTEGANITVTVY